MPLLPDRVEYLPITGRPLIEWPDGERLALWVALNVEHYEYLPSRSPLRDPWPRTPHPDVQQYSYRDYGNRVGFWRLLPVLDKHRIRCTASLNLAVLERYPEIRDAMVARDWDFMSHGIYNTDFLHGMSVEQEREFYRDCKEMLLRQTGKELKGMFGPGGSGTEDTPDLMAEAGLIYHCEWWHDDQPFPIKVREGKLISVPYSIDINDAVVLANGFESDYFCQMIKDQFDELYAEGAESGRVMCIALHPFLTGQPHRIEHLDEALEYILSHDGVWRTTADAIADYYYRRYYDPMLEHLEQVKAQAVG